jgi:hypothetical protein
MRLDLSLNTSLSIKLTYRQFLNTELGAQAYGRFKHGIYSDEDSLVQTLNNNILQNLPVISRDVLRVCDIGGGDGRRIRAILKFLHDKFGLRFELDFVEQSSYLMRSFAPDDISPFTQTEKFEMLFEQTNLKGGYDLIFLIHSIFAFEDRSAVDKILSLPKREGAIVVISNAADSFLAGLKKIVDTGYSDTRYEITDLLEILRERGIKHRQIPKETKWAVFKDNLSQHIDTILEWLSLGKRTEMDEDRQAQIREYVHRNSADLGQRVLFTEREMVVVVSE